MFWTAIAAGLNIAKGLFGAQAANDQANAQYTNQLRAEEQAWTTNLNDNQAIEDANLQNTIRTGYRAGILNVQRGQAKAATVQSGLSIDKSALLLKGQNSANSFAAGQMGASVDAVALDIQQKQDEAHAQVDKNYILQESNFDQQMYDVLTAGQDSLQSARKVQVQHAAQPNYISAGSALLNSVIQTAGQYASSQMSLNLGKKPDTGGAPTNEVF